MALHAFLASLAAAGVYTPPEPTYRPPTNGHLAAPPPAVNSDTQRYAWAALQGEVDRVATTPEGARNHELNKAAFRMGQLAALGYISEYTITDHLSVAGRACGLSTGEVAATVASGLRAGLAHPRDRVELRPGPAPDAAVLDVDTPVTPVPELSGTGADSPGQVADSPRYRPVDWHDLWAEVAPEPDWLIPDVIERGRSHALYGPAKSGKSLLTLAMVAALASGRAPLGRTGADRPVRVMYIDEENALADLRERLAVMGYGPDDLSELTYFSFPSLPGLDSAAGARHLHELVEEYRPDLVVLDTTSRVVAGEENSADTFRALYRWALVPLKAAGIAVWRIDHTGKDVTAGQRGSSAKDDDVDTVWLLVPRGSDRFTLRLTRQRSGHHPGEVELVRQGDPLRFLRLDGAADRPEVAGLVAQMDRLGLPSEAGRDRARQLLAEAGVKAATNDLAEAVKIRKLQLDLSEISRNVCPRTGSGQVDHELINIGCPEDQNADEEIADQTCPGQVEDRSDRSTGVPLAGPVPACPPLDGGQGTGQPGPDPDGSPQSAPRCDRCHQQAERIIPGTRGQRWCPACAYPTDPGVHDQKEEE